MGLPSFLKISSKPAPSLIRLLSINEPLGGMSFMTKIYHSVTPQILLALGREEFIFCQDLSLPFCLFPKFFASCQMSFNSLWFGVSKESCRDLLLTCWNGSLLRNKVPKFSCCSFIDVMAIYPLLMPSHNGRTY